MTRLPRIVLTTLAAAAPLLHSGSADAAKFRSAGPGSGAGDQAAQAGREQSQELQHDSRGVNPSNAARARQEEAKKAREAQAPELNHRDQVIPSVPRPRERSAS